MQTDPKNPQASPPTEAVPSEPSPKKSSVTQTSWILKPHSKELVDKLRLNEIGSRLHPALLGLLVQRDVHTDQQVKEFLDPLLSDLSDPFELPSMRLAVERIFAAIDAKEEVIIFGDYDADGITSTYTLQSALEAYGLKTHCYLPNRFEDGYGLTEKGLGNCLKQIKSKQKTVPKLLIAVDCGSNSAREVAQLEDQGIDTIVIDHHEVSSPAEAYALVNPKLGEEHHYLCTAGLIFKVIHAMLKERFLENFDLREFLDIIALGTIADVVPLKNENRILVRKGLLQMSSTVHPGLKALSDITAIPSKVLASHLGFRIGPRLNAAGRLESAQQALELLNEKEASAAQKKALKLDHLNRERQNIEAKIVEEAEEMLSDEKNQLSHSVILGNEKWHPGVVGIVSSRIMRKYNLPAILVAFDEADVGKGSGRSTQGTDLIHALEASREFLVNGGGHEQAVGITVHRDHFDKFREAFNASLADSQGEIPPSTLEIDQIINFEALTPQFLEQYELFEPFGMGNPQPLFFSSEVYPAEEPKRLKEKHLKMTLTQNGLRRDAIYFSAPLELPEPPWDIAYHFERNEFRGKVYLQLQIKAIRATSPLDGNKLFTQLP